MHVRNNIKELNSSLKSIVNSQCVLKIKQIHITITQYFMIYREPLLADLRSLSGLMAKPKQTEMINKIKPDARFIVYKLLIFGSEKGQEGIEHHLMANFKLLPNLFAHKTQQAQMLYTSEQALKAFVREHSSGVLTLYSLDRNNNRFGVHLAQLPLLWFICSDQTGLQSAAYLTTGSN